MENINIDEYISILDQNKAELRKLKSADVWDIKINPMLGVKQVTGPIGFSLCLVLEHKFYTLEGEAIANFTSLPTPLPNMQKLLSLSALQGTRL